ncbi:MAG: Bug family tripartite tricarboxylate transporter substrate binding protein [Ramlibacter sp.]
MHPMTRRASLATLAAASTALLAPAAFSQAPTKPLRVILPVAAGSGVDAAIRAMSNGVGKALGQSLVIENLPGAGGITGTTQIVKAPKDGSAIGVVSNNHVVNPSVYKNVPFHAVDDVTPIMVVGAIPFVLVVHPSVPAKNLTELVALAKAKPGTLNYGSSGNGTILHLAGAMLVNETQADIRHIPYRGMGQLTNDVLGGQIQMAFISASVAATHVKAGTLRAFGVTTPKRTPVLPDVPTIAEQGYPNYALDGWFGPIGPAGMPKAEVARIHKGFKDALATPEVRDALLAQGYTLWGSTPEEAQAYFRSEVVRMARLVQAAGVRID